MTHAQASIRNKSSIPVDAIDVLAGRRVLDPNWVKTLAADFHDRGQRTPIEVIQTGERYRLVVGGHRLAAVSLVGWSHIDAIVNAPEDFANEAEIRLAEIVENFMRRELSVLDRAMDVAAWREIYEAVKGAVKPGRKTKAQADDELDEISRKFATNFTEAAQKALGLSRDAIFRSLKIARIGESIRQRIALHDIADNQSELLALVGHPVDRQAAIVNRLLAGAGSVADAIAIIDNLAPEIPQAAWERMSERFSRLKSDEQARFFALHEEAILAWMASR